MHTHSSEPHPEQWAAILRRPGSSWGIGALLKGLTAVVVLKVERALVIHSPTDNPCRTWESNLQPLGYKSNSLTIRPRLPQGITRSCMSGFCHFGLVLFMVLWQSPDTPVMSCFHVSAWLRVCFFFYKTKMLR